MEPINFFMDPKYLEPKCPDCNTVIDYGVTTRYSEKSKAHICIKCGRIVD